MNKKFAGFTQQQTEVLARKLGFKGPMEQFQNFLKSDSGLQQKFSAYESKAKKMVESSKTARGFAEGGLVDRTDLDTNPTGTVGSSSISTVNLPYTDASGKPGSTTISAVTPNPNSPGATLTNDMLTNPGNYVTTPTTSGITVSPDQLVGTNSGQATGTPDTVAGTGTAVTAGPVVATDPRTVSTSTVSDSVADATQDMVAATGTVSDGATVEAVTVDPSVRATVAGQLESLMAQFEGGNLPPWAAGAIRNVNGIMAGRGLGASSIAASASTQAAMESALEIAVRDAATYSQFELANLNNRQQAAMYNAQAFLQMDLANLDNEQQMALARSQAIIQGLFSDQAAENATRQFNATSQQQSDQFFASLRTQVDQFNASQMNAMEQFNVSQKNATDQFNREVNERRDQFNAANRLIVDQSNAEWRRQVTTINNAEANENARLTAQMLTGMTTAAYNNIMQRERDEYSFLYQASENALQRAADMVMAKYYANASSRTAKGEALGALAGSIIGGIFS